MAAKRPLRRRNRPWVRRFKRTAVVLGYVFGIALAAGLAVYIPIYQEASDDAVNIENRLKVESTVASKILSADGKILYSVAAVRRQVIDLFDAKYPAYVRYALVAAEDRRFFDHRGVDPVGLARAVYRRGTAGGGSTIPMQLAKNLVNGDDRSLRRKLKDIATAQQIESLKSKQEILNLYANTSYFGQRAFGIERAAEIYFNKSADKLTVGEAALLARCVRTPSRINPVRNLQKMLPMRDYVLNVMREEGWITEGQYEEGVKEVPRVYRNRASGLRTIVPAAGYFVQHVLSQLKKELPEDADFDSGGYTVHTTLNYALQKRAVIAVNQVLDDNRGHNVNDGAIVVMDSQGRILCEVGGPDYEKRQHNVITQGHRQPGSAFKAIVYATALKNGKIHPGSYLSNAPIHKKLDDGTWWNPQNGSRKENAPGYSLETAFALSVNRPAIHTIEEVGPDNVVAAAHDIFGIQSPLQPFDSLALGTSEVTPLEMLEAYSVFMLGGSRVAPQAIVRIDGPHDEPGHPLKEYQPEVKTNALDPKIAQQMDEILKTPVQYGTATFAQVVPNARGKTGTTNSAKDAWFCGYSDGLVGVGWVGHSVVRNGKPYALPMSSSVFGGTVTVKIWTAVMQAAHNPKLKITLGVGHVATPNTSVSASEAVPEEKPVRDEEEDALRPDPGDKPELPKEPITIEPTPAPPVDDVPKIDGDGGSGDPSAAAPATEPSATDPDQAVPDAPPADETRRRDRPRRREAKRQDEDTVEVDICVDTGLRANEYCPETVIRSFPRGRAPRRTCNLHHG